MRDERTYENLQKLIEIVIDFDDKLYEQIMKKRYDLSNKDTNIFYEALKNIRQRYYLKKFF